MNYLKNENFLKRIALLAGVFSFVISVILIVNFIQYKKADPVNSDVINSLVEKLNQNPNDKQLRDQIRVIDLIARKAYFTSRWQVRTGGYLLLAGISVLLIALTLINSQKKKTKSKSPKEDLFSIQIRTRNIIAISGALLFLITLLITFLSDRELKNKFKEAAIQSTVNNQQTEVGDQISVTGDQIPAPGNQQQKDTNTNISTSSNHQIIKSGNDNFPAFRGPGNYGIAHPKDIPVSWDGAKGKNVLWKTEVPLPGNNSPIIWNDKLFLTGANASSHEVYCFDIQTGKILWTVPVKNIPGAPSSSPKVTDEAGFSAPTATTDGFAVYAIFSNGDLIAIDFNGKQLWAQNLGLPQNHYGYASSLEMYKDKLIVQYDQRTAPRLIAFSAKTGKIIWTISRQVKISWASPIVVNTGKRTEIITAAEPFVASYNPLTGEELWKIDCLLGEVAPSLAYSNGIVFSVNDNSKLTAIKLGEQPKVLWENTDYLSEVPSPVAYENYLFVVTSSGEVVCYDAQTGTQYWEHELDKNVFSSPVIAEGKVYLLDREGTAHIFKVDKTYKSLGECKLGEKTVATPAFSNGHIYFRGAKNLYCIGKKD
jgi:outer membrane protein assembly factor BamB